MSHLALFLLGPPRIERNGKPVEIVRRKAIALLACLAVTGQSHSRDSLAALLWPEYDQRRARADLRRILPVLNKALNGDWLNIERDRVGLNQAGETKQAVKLLQFPLHHPAVAQETRDKAQKLLADLSPEMATDEPDIDVGHLDAVVAQLLAANAA